MISESDRAYIAGLFDGEGSVSFTFKKAAKNGKRYGKIYARISNTNKAVLDWVKVTSGLGYVVGKGVAQREGHKPCYDFVVAYEQARKFLVLIRPYLRIKGITVDEKLSLDKLHVIRRSAGVA